MRVMVLMPAHNTAHTLEQTVAEIPAPYRSSILVVDDGSTDGTGDEARRLGLEVIAHPNNRGYGAVQKTGFREALRRDLDAVVLVHSDHQYDPTALPEIFQTFESTHQSVRVGAVLASRRLAGDPRALGMPSWRYAGNRLLTRCENHVLGLQLTDYHTGLRAYTATALRDVRFEENADGFLFDQQILAQVTAAGFHILEVRGECRYTEETSSISFRRSVGYGLGTLWLLAQYRHHIRHPSSPSFLAPRLSDKPVSSPDEHLL